jgi:TolB-like protein
MKRLFTLLLALAAAVPASAQQAARDTRPGMAVLPFENGGSFGRDAEDFDALRGGIAAVLIDELAQNPAVRVVDRTITNQIISEQNLARDGRVDGNTAARIGKLVGARYMVTGSFMDAYGNFRVTARIIDVETGEILKVVSNDETMRDRRQMYKIFQNVAQKLMAGVNLPALPTQVAQAAERRNIPTEALTFYSRALLYEDRGDKPKAADYFRRATEAYPGYAQAEEGLRRTGGTPGTTPAPATPAPAPSRGD